jgi:hypothetical protein
MEIRREDDSRKESNKNLGNGRCLTGRLSGRTALLATDRVVGKEVGVVFKFLLEL